MSFYIPRRQMGPNERIKRTMLNNYAISLGVPASDADDTLYEYCCSEVDETWDDNDPFTSAANALQTIADDVSGMAEEVRELASDARKEADDA